MAIASHGNTFIPEHLQPENFSNLKSSIANGFLAPGVIEAVVELDQKNTDFASRTSENSTKIDEGSFLSNKAYSGISVQELIGQEKQRTSAGTSDLSSESFAVVKSSNRDGKMFVTSLRSSSPSISIVANTALPAKTVIRDLPEDMIEEVKKPEGLGVDPRSQISVKFIDPAIDGILNEDKINSMGYHEHLENFLTIAPQIPNLEIFSKSHYPDLRDRRDLPSFASPKLKVLEYVGYLIEKYKRDSTGAFVKIEEIDVPNKETNEYYDTKVLYGEIYRYRIRTIARWTRKDSEGDISGFKNSLAKYRSTYIASSWSKSWSYAACLDQQPPPPPDEISVYPQSSKKRVLVTCRVPENSQKDITHMVVMRRAQSSTGQFLSRWEPLFSTGPGRTLSNISFFDKDIKFFQEDGIFYVYTAQCFTTHGESSCFSEQLSVRLNSEFMIKGEFPVQMISSRGVRPENYGAFETIPPKRTKTSVILPILADGNSKKASLKVSGRNEVGDSLLADSSYVLRLESLDTGEKKDIEIQVDYVSTEDRVETRKNDSFPTREEIANNNPGFDRSSGQR
jgi:hypothetical protein